jgi:hypothetical protein
MLFLGCGPDRAEERDQWALADIAPIVLEHFAVGRDSGSPARSKAGVAR